MHGSLIASTAMPILVPPTTGEAFLTGERQDIVAEQWVALDPRGDARPFRGHVNEC